MATQRSKDSNWENAQRLYFSGDPTTWELRNKIKQHSCKRLISVPLMFSHLRDNLILQQPAASKRDIAIAAAAELLDLLNDISNRPYLED